MSGQRDSRSSSPDFEMGPTVNRVTGAVASTSKQTVASTSRVVASTSSARPTLSVPNPPAPCAFLTPSWLPSSVIYASWGTFKGSSKIAAFDVDGTFIRPLNKRTFPNSSTDYEFVYPLSTILSALSSFTDAGYSIVLLSNQRYNSNSKPRRDFMAKMQVVAPMLSSSGVLMAATEHDQYRKPQTGMWDLLERRLNDGVLIDKKRSFYVGDAAGRYYDHSDSDKAFAKNAGIVFYTESEFFDPKSRGNDVLKRGHPDLAELLLR